MLPIILIVVIAILVFYILKNKNDNVSKDTQIDIIGPNKSQDVDFLIIDESEDDEDFATVLINTPKDREEIVVRLINESNGSMEIIKIGTKEYTIGRLKKEVDFHINDETVSRKHATLLCKDNKLYVRDLNSKNKVYINKREIDTGKFYEIRDNYSVKFGNVEYTFEINEKA